MLGHAAHWPPEQLKLQHDPCVVHALPSWMQLLVHVVEQAPAQQRPLQHCSAVLHELGTPMHAGRVHTPLVHVAPTPWQHSAVLAQFPPGGTQHWLVWH